MKTFIGIVIVASCIGAPAFAQSFDPDNGTGNVGKNIVATAPAPADSKLVTGSLGEQAYAMSARRKLGEGHAETENTGSGNPAGGSVGYNEMLNNW